MCVIFICMTGTELKSARLASSFTQNEAAAKLRVTQPYLSMVERGTRAVSPELRSRAMSVFEVAATALPLAEHRPRFKHAGWFKEALGALGYPGFAYLRSTIKVNPAELLMDALDSQDLDSRVVEALPWVVFAYPNLNWDWLVLNAKVHDRQNRLGFVVELAKQVARIGEDSEIASELAQRLGQLERSRLIGEDTLCKESMTQAERKWLRTNRSEAALHWNLLADLRAEQLDHALA